ncbi:MAG: hypothetical protein ACPGRC_05825 [Salibacteraceae bacterium]
MRFYICIVTIIGLSFSLTGFGQDTILFLNGKIEVGTLIETNDLTTTYSIVKGKKNKVKVKETTTIFGVLTSEGLLDTLYSVNESEELTLSANDMYLFILGEQDAKKYYKTQWASVGGLIFGAGFGYLLYDGFYVAAVPMVYTVGAGVSNVKVVNGGNRSTKTLTNPAYQEGYIKVARAKKSFYALGSSTIGTIIGALIGHSQN